MCVCVFKILPPCVLWQSWLPDWGALSDPFFLYPPWTNLKLTLARIVVGLS